MGQYLIPPVIGHQNQAPSRHVSGPGTRYPDLRFERTLAKNGVRHPCNPLEILGSRGLTGNILQCHIGILRQSDDLFVIQIRHRPQSTCSRSQMGLVRQAGHRMSPRLPSRQSGFRFGSGTSRQHLTNLDSGRRTWECGRGFRLWQSRPPVVGGWRRSTRRGAGSARRCPPFPGGRGVPSAWPG